jgi:hypothetical protein
MKTFVQYAQALKLHWKAALAAAIVPAVCLPLSMCPPWPDRAGATSCAIAALFSVVGIVVVYSTSTRSAKRAKTFARGFGAAAATCLVFYIASWSLWVGNARQVAGEEQRVAEMQFVKGAYLESPSNELREKDLLRVHGYRVEEVYTSLSLMISRLSLLLSFSGAFFCLTAAFGFTASSRRR